MKKLVFNFLFVAALAFAGSNVLMSCGSKSHDEVNEHAEGDEAEEHEEGLHEEHEGEMHEGDDNDSEEMTYACPMHPEEKGKEGDKCSKCKMALKKVETETEQ